MPVSTPVIAVTGATGLVGGAIAALLAEDDIEQRLIVRSPGRAPRLDGASVMTAHYENTAESRAALSGVNLLFMVSAAEAVDRLEAQCAFIDAAEAAGVSHVIYTSFVGAAEDATFTLARDHWATEQHLRASGMNYTILRDNFYQDVFPEFADENGVIRGPAGDGRVAAVARIDVARCAAAILRDPAGHRGRVYNLTGPEALNLTEIAELITRHAETPATFVDETVAEAYESRADYHAPQWQLDAWVSTYTAIASGELAAVTDTVQQLTGHPATSFAQLLAARSESGPVS